MPYAIEKVSNGYYVIKISTGERFSHHPLSLVNAKKQLSAIGMHTHMNGEGLEDKTNISKNILQDKTSYITYRDKFNKQYGFEKDASHLNKKKTSYKSNTDKEKMPSHKPLKNTHALRYLASRVNAKNITNPKHLGIISLSNKLLKQEEIYGEGFFSSALSWIMNPIGNTLDAIGLHEAASIYDTVAEAPDKIINSIPGLSYALPVILTAVAPEFEVPFLTAEAAEAAGYEAGSLGFKLVTTLTPNTLISMRTNDTLFGDDTYRNSIWAKSGNSGKMPADFVPSNKQIQDYIASKNPTVPNADAFIDEMVNRMGQVDASTGESISGVNAFDPNRSLTNELARNANGEIIPMPTAYRFPTSPIYDYRDKPLDLVAHLAITARSGSNLIKTESDLVKAQNPYAFLNFPANGGNRGKIEFQNISKNHYKSKGKK